MILDDARRALLASKADWAVVQAFAGAGKTHLAIEIAKRFRAEPGLQPGQRILFISFSTASCTRARESLRGSAIPNDEVEVCTFHSFALALVRRYAERLGLSGPVSAGTRAVSRGTLVSFDRLVEHAQELLGEDDVIDVLADAYPLVIVDEFQDTSGTLLRLLRDAFVGRSVVRCFGDSDQRIQPGAQAFNALEESRQGGAQPHRIQPIKGACRYEDFDLAHLAKSFRDARPFRGAMGSIEVETVGADNEQLAHKIYWPLRSALQNNRTAAVVGFSNSAVGKVAGLLSSTTDKRPARIPCSPILASDLAAARDELYLALLRHWVAPTEESLDAALRALAMVTVAGRADRVEPRHKKLIKALKKGNLPDLPTCADSPERRRPEEVVEELSATISALSTVALEMWKSANWPLHGLDGLAWSLSQAVPEGLRLGDVGWDERLAREWDQARRWRTTDPRPPRLLTANQAKNRQFDDVIVYVDGFENKLRGPISPLNKMQMYVAVSRARRWLRIVSIANKKTRRCELLDVVLGGGG